MIGVNSLTKKIVAILFTVFLLLGFIRNGSYITMNSFANYLKQQDFHAGDAISVSGIENDFTSSIWKHKELINLNGLMANKLNMHGLYSDMGMYVTNDKYIVSASPYTTTDYEVEETINFRDYLEANGINLLYVNEPTKYIDDDIFKREFGIETYSNRNIDLFLNRIREAGVNTIDLRDNIREENLNISDLFYRTDHHWTTPAGLWATKIMASGLNNYCGYNIDTSVFDESNFVRTDWSECWLGEQGRKVAQTYVGLDDYTELKPAYETNYTFRNSDGTTYNGSFDSFVNESVYNTENDVYENTSWHYSYNRIDCINNNIEHGKILILGDSYDHVTQPFLSLQVHEVDSLILRSYDDSFSLRDYIVSNGYDTVIIAYAQFMVGAHDNPSSANYRMFTFDY
ncbi:MAG: hypothetical protein ACI3VZ_07265 [Faecousia sp.]